MDSFILSAQYIVITFFYYHYYYHNKKIALQKGNWPAFCSTLVLSNQ